MLSIYVFYCFLIILASANSSFRTFLSSSSRNLALNFEEDSKETISDSMNSSYFFQNKFKKTFKFLHNNSKSVYIRVNFTKITSNTNFPLISLSDDKGYNHYDFESFFAKNTTHYLEYKICSNLNEKFLYLTVFNLFTNSESSEDFLEYFITMRTGLLWKGGCDEIWGNSDCEDNPLILQPNYIKFEENYQYTLKKGEMKYFYSNFPKKMSDSQLILKNSELLVFLNVSMQIENESQHRVFLNSAGFYFFEEKLNFPDYYYYDDHLSFILFAPLNDKPNEISVNLTISANDYNKSIEFSKTVAVILILGIIICAGKLCLLFLEFITFKYKKLTKRIMNLYFPAKTFEFFRKNSNNSEECVICLQEFINGDMCRELYCLHLFHESCLDPWILINQTCPVCRKEYNKSILDQEKILYIEKIKANVLANSRNSGKALLSTTVNDELNNLCK